MLFFKNHTIIKKMKKIFILAILAVVALASCKKENFEHFTPTESQLESKTITASFSGIIVGSDEKGLEDVTVTIGSNTTTTDENGVFFFKNISVTNTKAYFQAKKAGYFNGSRTVFAQEGETHQIRIKMLDAYPIGSFMNDAGGEITLPEGGKITFEAGDVAYTDGSAYTGQVMVAAKRIDPTTSNGLFEMPGDLRGMDADNQLQVLASYGMMAVELTDNSGNLLQVAPNQTVDITFEIPTSLTDSAPENIPLWHFDEATGDWKEDGSATLSGTTYVGQVSHFSFWNWDAKFETVKFEAIFVDEAGNPIPNARIGIELPSGWMTIGYTNSAGWVGGLVQANTTMKLYYDNSVCDYSYNMSYLQDFTTTDVDINLGTLTITINGPTTYTLTGKVVDCSDDPVTNGYIQITSPYWYLQFSSPLESDGSFSFEYTTCESVDSIHLIAYDYDNLVSSNNLAFDISTSTDLGTIKACDVVLDEFFTMNYTTWGGNDTTQTIYSGLYFQEQIDSITTDITGWRIYGNDPTGSFFLMFKDTIVNPPIGVGTFICYASYETQSGFSSFDASVTVTSYPTNPGDFMIGTLESIGISPIVTGSFKIKR